MAAAVHGYSPVETPRSSSLNPLGSRRTIRNPALTVRGARRSQRLPVAALAQACRAGRILRNGGGTHQGDPRAANLRQEFDGGCADRRDNQPGAVFPGNTVHQDSAVKVPDHLTSPTALVIAWAQFCSSCRYTISIGSETGGVLPG